MARRNDGCMNYGTGFDWMGNGDSGAGFYLADGDAFDRSRLAPGRAQSE